MEQKIIVFPEDFVKQPHQISKGGFQWVPKVEQQTFISIVGGGRGLYGDGVKTFEIMIGEDVNGWCGISEVNELLSDIR